MSINIPNLLTLLRILLIPVIIFFHMENEYALSLLFLLVGVTSDFFDGYFARKLNQITDFGAIFDPIADKIVAISIYSYIGYYGLAPVWFVSILLIRNISQALSIPILIWWLDIKFYVKPTLFSKAATAISDIYMFVPLFILVWFEIPEMVVLVFMIFISISETYILLTYLPRLIAIARGKHDTFV